MPLHFRFKIGPLVYTERIGGRSRPAARSVEPAQPWPPPGVKPLRPTPRWKVVTWLVVGGVAIWLALFLINKLV